LELKTQQFEEITFRKITGAFKSALLITIHFREGFAGTDFRRIGGKPVSTGSTKLYFNLQ
jgi:hypothetical protein